MRTLLRTAVLAVSAATVFAAASCDEYLGNTSEGLNIHNMTGKILIPKAVLGSNELGVVYVGVFSGVDNRLGYLSPAAAPAQVGGGDTFPYGGTSIGDFYTRDARVVCTQVSDRNVIDNGTELELDFSILQFPFYPGSAVWAFADTGNDTCNGGGGFYDAFAIPVTPTDVTASGTATGPVCGPNFLTDYVVTLESTDISAFTGAGVGVVQLSDPYQRLYKAKSVNPAAHTVTVTDFYNYCTPPKAAGPFASQLKKPNSRVYYGTEYQNVLNFPATYINPGDLVPSTATTITDTAPVTITLDAKVN